MRDRFFFFSFMIETFFHMEQKKREKISRRQKKQNTVVKNNITAFYPRFDSSHSLHLGDVGAFTAVKVLLTSTLAALLYQIFNLQHFDHQFCTSSNLLLMRRSLPETQI